MNRSFTWRNTDDPADERLYRQFEAEDDGWPPLRAGLFGGSSLRADRAFLDLLPYLQQVRSQQF